MHHKNSLSEAIKRRRMEKTKGLDEMHDGELESVNEKAKESGLAPEIKEHGEGEAESQMHSPLHEDSNQMEQMVADDMDMHHEPDVDDLIKPNPMHPQEDVPHGIYQSGDEHMKGFMGKAARALKAKLSGKKGHM